MTRTLLAPALALTALVGAQAAQAQTACVAPEDAADAVIYMMPTAYDAALKSCGNQIAADSFLRSNKGKAFIEGFRTQQNARWDGAFRFLKVFVASELKGDEAMMRMVTAMPPEALRPFLDAMVGQIIGQEIKPDTCAKIERGAALVSPLPVENVGGLVAFILAEVDIKEPQICKTARPATATATATATGQKAPLAGSGQ